jgi:cytochrome c556
MIMKSRPNEWSRPVKHFLLAAAALAGIAAAAAAQNPAPAADTIRTRQANYKQMGAAMKAINDQMRGGAPSIGAVRAASRTIVGHAPNVLRWFPRGTGPETGLRTRARPEIWSDHAGFTRAGATLLVAARGLDAAARRGDVAAVRAAVPAVARACSGCHDDYRAPEH